MDNEKQRLLVVFSAGLIFGAMIGVNYKPQTKIVSVDTNKTIKIPNFSKNKIMGENIATLNVTPNVTPNITSNVTPNATPNITSNVPDSELTFWYIYSNMCTFSTFKRPTIYELVKKMLIKS